MDTHRFQHPYDTPLSSALRFATELIAWTSGPWAAGKISWLLVPIALIALVALPSLFSTVGDKRTVIVPTPGSARALLELFLFGIAAAAPWLVWHKSWAVVSLVTVVLALIFGYKRLAWLFRGAPLDA